MSTSTKRATRRTIASAQKDEDEKVVVVEKAAEKRSATVEAVSDEVDDGNQEVDQEADRAPAPDRDPATMKARDIYVAGVSQLTETELRSFFEDFGVVESITLPVYQQSGRSRGFAFIRFGSSDAKQSVLETTKYTINEHVVTVKDAADKPKKAEKHAAPAPQKKAHAAHAAHAARHEPVGNGSVKDRYAMLLQRLAAIAVETQKLNLEGQQIVMELQNYSR